MIGISLPPEVVPYVIPFVIIEAVLGVIAYVIVRKKTPLAMIVAFVILLDAVIVVGYVVLLMWGAIVAEEWGFLTNMWGSVVWVLLTYLFAGLIEKALKTGRIVARR